MEIYEVEIRNILEIIKMVFENEQENKKAIS